MHENLAANLRLFNEGFEALADPERLSTNQLGTWRRKVVGLTDEVMKRVVALLEEAVKQVQDLLGLLRKAMERAMELAQMVERLEPEPSEAGLRNLAQELPGVRGKVQSFGRILILNQDPSLAAYAHELIVEAEEAICKGQQRIRRALQRMGAAPEGPDAGSLTNETTRKGQSPPRRAGGPTEDFPSSFRWRTELAGGRVRDRIGESELATLIWCLSGAQANDSGWSIFKGKNVEYPRFRKEWWAYRRTYHSHLRDELVSQALKEKSLVGNARSMVNHIEDLQEI
jgi:hypothetical protein